MYSAVKYPLSVLFAAAVAVAFAAGAAHAQGAPPPEMQQQQQQPSQITVEQLEAVAGVQEPIRQVQQKYQTRIRQAQSEQEVQQLQDRLNSEVIQTIQGAGLSVEEYNMILVALQQDPQLRQKYDSVTR